MVDRARAVNAGAGVALLFVAGLIAAYAFTIHERLYALGVFVIGVMAMSFLLLIGTAFSLVFSRDEPSIRTLTGGRMDRL